MRHQRYFKLARCLHCNDILKISYSMYGKPFSCPKCGKVLKLISKKEKKKIDADIAKTVQIKNLPEKPKKIVRRIIDGIKHVLRLRKDKDS